MGGNKKVTGGVYLVIDPSVAAGELMEKVYLALEGGISTLQIWNNWPHSFTDSNKQELIVSILDLARGYAVPVLINENWQLLQSTNLDGVHFDKAPDNIDQIRDEIGRDFILGITCSNDLEVVKWAHNHEADYISFCSMFPSSSVDSCDIVSLENVKKARAITDVPIFLSGGISLNNLNTFKGLDFEGVAVISGILSAEDPTAQVKNYTNELRKTR